MNFSLTFTIHSSLSLLSSLGLSTGNLESGQAGFPLCTYSGRTFSGQFVARDDGASFFNSSVSVLKEEGGCFQHRCHEAFPSAWRESPVHRNFCHTHRQKPGGGGPEAGISAGVESKARLNDSSNISDPRDP